MSSRQDPQGKRALFEAPPTPVEDPLDDDVLVEPHPPNGIRSIFSTGPHLPGTAVIDCSHCGARTRSSFIDLAVRICLVSLWVPGKHYSRWLQCPNCQRRSWCRVAWRE
jgi:hypothetical protein